MPFSRRVPSPSPQASPIPSSVPSSPLDTLKTGTTSTNGGMFAPALSLPPMNTSSPIATTGLPPRRRRPRNVISRRPILSKDLDAVNDGSSKDSSLAMAQGNSTHRANVVALDTDGLMGGGERREGSRFGDISTTEISSGGRGLSKDVAWSTGEGAERTSDAGRGGERRVVLGYGRATSGEILRRKHDRTGIVGVAHNDFPPRRMSGSDHVAGSPAREGWAQTTTSAPPRKSTGAMQHNYKGKRRGTRAVVIEEPEIGGGGGDALSGARMPRQSLSFCTVPLPRELTPSGAGPPERNAVSLDFQRLLVLD